MVNVRILTFSSQSMHVYSALQVYKAHGAVYNELCLDVVH